MGTQKELEDLILKYQKAYYDGNELISDTEFDKLWDELKINYPDSSLLTKVGSDTVKGKKIKHIISMGSQLKFNNEEDFRKWLKSEEIEFPLIVEDKIDGNSCELQYKNGKLLYGVTRGDGYYGEDITRVVTHMISVPQTVSFEGAVRGEIVMNRSLFEKKYAKDFKNPRNLTAGLLKNENFNDFNDLRFIAYDITKNFQTEKSKREYLTNEGFDVVKGVGCCTPEEVLEYREIRNPKDSEYNIDGLILRQNRVDPEDRNKLLPKKIHAFKWEDDARITILREIEWSMTGDALTPVACFDPVELEGTTVKRASLANPSLIEELNLKIGDKIVVVKRGQIIPKIERVEEHCGTEEIRFPSICPKCGKPLTLRDNKTKLYCNNPECSSHLKAQLSKWLNTLDVKGFGPALQDYVVENKWIEKLSDIYEVDYEKLSKEYGSVNVLKAFEDLYVKSREISLAQLIGGMDYDLIGVEVAQMVIDAGFDTLDKIQKLTKEDLLKVDGFSETRALSFIKNVVNNSLSLLDIIDKGNIKIKEVRHSENASFAGVHFCVTGKLEHFSRKDIEQTIKDVGAIVDSNVTPKTGYLITNTPDSGSSKNVNARKFGTKIITETEFEELIKC